MTKAGEMLLANIQSGAAALFHDDPVIAEAIAAIEAEAAQAERERLLAAMKFESVVWEQMGGSVVRAEYISKEAVLRLLEDVP